MIWLRHEMWEDKDGPSYRLASRAETERLAANFPEAVLKQVFYAPSPATAVAQYYALRHLGPYVPGADVSQDGFVLSQLESQSADFPDDEILASQAAPHRQTLAASSEPVIATVEDTVAAPLSVVSEAAPTPPHDPRDLWPVLPDEIPPPRWSRRRKPRLILGLLRLVLLLIVLAAVALGLCVAAGVLDGPALLAQARTLPVVGPLLP